MISSIDEGKDMAVVCHTRSEITLDVSKEGTSFIRRIECQSIEVKVGYKLYHIQPV